MLDLTLSQLRCLLTVYELEGKTPGVASKEIAVQLRLSRPSVHRLLEGLIGRGLVLKEPYGGVYLAEKGRETAAEMECLREKGGRALRECFGMAAEEADRVLLLLLSGMEKETVQRIAGRGTGE